MLSESEHEYSIRCRGIYSTTLTKLLLDNNFKITQSSDIIRERLSLNVYFDEPDLSIQDIWNKQGILCWGKEDVIESFVKLLQENLLDVIIRRSFSGKDAILKGKVVSINKYNQSSILDFGDFKGVIENKIYPPGTYLLTKVLYPDLGRRKAILTTNVTIPGINSVLIHNSQNKLSKKISDYEIRKKLASLAISIKPRNWGILWRTSAADAIQEDENILIEEIDRMTELSNQILKNYKQLREVGIVYEGMPTINAEFPSISKNKLDSIRSEIEDVFTIPNHHFYKILGENFSFLVNFVENLIHKIPQNKNQIVHEFQNYNKNFYPNEDDLIRIYHVKIDGRIFFLSPGKILSFDKETNKLRLKRELGGKTRTYYNGIGSLKEEGDYAILDCHLGEWYIKTEYFSKDGESKGIYWNINTPIEFYINPFRIHYVDLEIDLVKRTDGTIKILDEDKLEIIFNEKYISEKLKQCAYDKLYELKNVIEKDQETS